MSAAVYQPNDVCTGNRGRCAWCGNSDVGSGRCGRCNQAVSEPITLATLAPMYACHNVPDKPARWSLEKFPARTCIWSASERLLLSVPRLDEEAPALTGAREDEYYRELHSDYLLAKTLDEVEEFVGNLVRSVAWSVEHGGTYTPINLYDALANIIGICFECGAWPGEHHNHDECEDGLDEDGERRVYWGRWETCTQRRRRRSVLQLAREVVHQLADAMEAAGLTDLVDRDHAVFAEQRAKLLEDVVFVRDLYLLSRGGEAVVDEVQLDLGFADEQELARECDDDGEG